MTLIKCQDLGEAIPFRGTQVSMFVSLFLDSRCNNTWVYIVSHLVVIAFAAFAVGFTFVTGAMTHTQLAITSIIIVKATL